MVSTWIFIERIFILFLTSGFGSTARQPIQTNGVHYDCGCIISQNGDLMQFERVNPSVLNVPAVYIAYFSTFGALVSFFLFITIFVSMRIFHYLGLAFVIVQ